MEQTAESKKTFISKQGKPWIIAVSVLGLLLIGTTAIYTVKMSRPQISESSPEKEINPPKQQAVSALGRLEPKGEVINVAPPPTLGGAKIKQLLVQEGDTVQVGENLAILDTINQKQAAVTAAQEQVNVAQANLEIIQAGAKTGEIDAQAATIKQLEAELSGETATNQATIARLERELDGEQQEQTATIERLEAELRDAQREYQRYQTLAQEGVISTSELDERQLDLEQAQKGLREAQARLKKTVESLAEQIAAEKAQSRKEINALTQELSAAKATLNQIAEVRPVDVQKAEAEVKQARAQLQEAKADLDLVYIKAPTEGQVLKIHTYPGEKVDDANGILELGKTEQMMVIAEVYESEIKQVKVGQKALIKSENNSFTGQLEGKVHKIGLTIGKKDVLDTDPAADVDVRVVEVEILLTPEASQIVSGLTYAKVVAEIQL